MTLFKWFWMLSKRLYKKPTFLVILAAIPLCVLALSFAARQQGGFLTIVLAQEDPNDPLSAQVVGEMLQEDSLIRFTLADSPEAALKTVTAGSADCAWIFPADMQGKIQRFVEDKSEENAFVRVVERETTVFSRIALEKLTAAMFAHCARAEYIRFIRIDADRLADVPEEALLQAYDAIALDEALFTYENAAGNAAQQNTNYLTAPIRGLLAVLICLCGAAACAYHLQDRQLGTFSLVKEHLQPLVAFACMMIAVVHIAVVATVALAATKLLGNVWREIPVVALYCICCAAFWMLLAEVLPNAKWLCATVPILVLCMVALCPVFFSFGFLRPVSHLLPPTYYINGAYDGKYLLYMPGFALAAFSGTAGLRWLKGRLRRR